MLGCWKHDFVEKKTWRLFFIWRRSSLTWPDPVQDFLLSCQSCAIKCAKCQHNPPNGSEPISERKKLMGWRPPPPPVTGRGLTGSFKVNSCWDIGLLLTASQLSVLLQCVPRLIPHSFSVKLSDYLADLLRSATGRSGLPDDLWPDEDALILKLQSFDLQESFFLHIQAT